MPVPEEAGPTPPVDSDGDLFVYAGADSTVVQATVDAIAALLGEHPVKIGLLLEDLPGGDDGDARGMGEWSQERPDRP